MAGFIHTTHKEHSMENQISNKPKSNFGISLLTGCGTSLAAFVVPVVLFYVLDVLLLPGESIFFLLMICGFGTGIIVAVVAAIAVGVTVYRALQPRPLASGLLSWAGISILMNIAIYGIGQLAEKYVQTLTSFTTEMLKYFNIIRTIELVIILVVDLLAIIVGWLVYRHQRSKLKQA
jgi:hypothetical protein